MMRLYYNTNEKCPVYNGDIEICGVVSSSALIGVGSCKKMVAISPQLCKLYIHYISRHRMEAIVVERGVVCITERGVIL
jgi:hypothetical protein